VNLRAPHPGNRHSRSRWRSARTIAALGSRRVRPRASGVPEASSTITWIFASHPRRCRAGGSTTPPPPSSSPGPPVRASSGACTTIVGGSVARTAPGPAASPAASSAHPPAHSATRPSARRAVSKAPPSSPGSTGTRAAMRSIARATTMPWSAGSSPDRPRRLPSSVHHQSRNRAPSVWRVSSRLRRTSRSARRRTAPGETPRAQATSPASVAGVANRVSSTAASIPSSPEPRARATRGSWDRTRAAPTHRWAFQPEIP
jgi:hypothetical protein